MEYESETTLREWFSRFTEETGEIPESVVFDWGGSYHAEEWPEIPKGLLRWADVPDVILDKPFEDGYGGNDSPNLCAWSKTWVIFSDNYDGAESLCWVPRNPIAHNPIRPGGG